MSVLVRDVVRYMRWGQKIGTPVNDKPAQHKDKHRFWLDSEKTVDICKSWQFVCMCVGGFLVCFSFIEKEEKKRGKIEHDSYKTKK